MSDLALDLLASGGVWALFAAAFLSCLALPIPTSLMMLTGGAFAASGDFALWQVMLGAFLGAVLGDQAGYFIGRFGGARLLRRLARGPARRAALVRAKDLVQRRGAWGVFFSTWALAPLGPWANVAAGATGLSWRRFTFADVPGEVIWVGLYTSLGALFAAHIGSIAAVMSNLVGLVVALALALIMALWIRAVLRHSPPA